MGIKEALTTRDSLRKKMNRDGEGVPLSNLLHVECQIERRCLEAHEAQDRHGHDLGKVRRCQYSSMARRAGLCCLRG